MQTGLTLPVQDLTCHGTDSGVGTGPVPSPWEGNPVPAQVVKSSRKMGLGGFEGAEWEPLTALPEAGYPWMDIPAGGNCWPLLGTQANGLIFGGTQLLNLSLMCSMAQDRPPSFWLCQQTGWSAFHDLSHRLQPWSPSWPCRHQLSLALYLEE